MKKKLTSKNFEDRNEESLLIEADQIFLKLLEEDFEEMTTVIEEKTVYYDPV